MAVGDRDMDESAAAALALEHADRHQQHPAGAFGLVPGSTIEKPYGWVVQLQSRTYLETGDPHSMLVGVGPTIVLHDGTVRTLGTARPPEEEIYAFEVDNGLAPTSDSSAANQDHPVDIPLWVGAQVGDSFPVLVLTPPGLVSAWLGRAELDHLVEHGPALLADAQATVAPLARIDRIRTDGETGLKVERRDDVDVRLCFATPAQRDRALAGMHRHLAPNAPLEQLRRPVRQFVEFAGIGVLMLGVGFTLPWMVEAGQIDRTQWIIATIFNALGPTGFRILGVALAALCLVGLIAISVNNPMRTGFRVRSARGR